MIKSTNNNFSVTFRTKKSVKDKASKLFDEMGLDMSSALNLFLNTVVIRKEIPFKIITENGYTQEFENKILNEYKGNKNWKKFATVEAMMKDLKN